MPSFGRRSKANYVTCHPDIQMILDEVIAVYDFSITCGHRTKEKYEQNLHDGTTTVAYEDSEHSHLPSLAVDMPPYPIDWKDINRFRSLMFFTKGVAYAMGIKIRLGIDWNDNLTADEKFVDGPHMELVSRLVDGEWIPYGSKT